MKPISNDDVDRLLFILRVLDDQTPEVVEIFTKHCRTALSVMLTAKTNEEALSLKVSCVFTVIPPPVRAITVILTHLQAKEKVGVKVHVDDPVTFMQLSNLRGSEFATTENVFELSLSQAVAGNTANAPDVHNILSASKLNKVTQLTGFSDPVYSEAYVHVNQYDIVLDVLIVNQTGSYFSVASSPAAVLALTFSFPLQVIRYKTALWNWRHWVI